jgi:hypothetical protein
MADDEPMLTGKLDAGARLLRADVPVRDAWRASLLASIAAEDDRGASIPRRPIRPRVWAVRPLTAIAAGISLVALGAGATLLVDGVHPVPPAPRIAGQATGPSPVRFVYVAPDARVVSVVGDFDGWRPVPLHRLADGRTWILEMPLTPGRYAYAFSVDGVLKADPTGARGADDDFGVANSVVMVRDQ